MSNSLVRASLELVTLETDLKQEKKKKKSRAKGVLDLIPLNHRITKTNKKIVFGRTKKNTLQEVKKQLAEKKDPTEENIRRLLLLSSSHLDSETADTLFNRAVSKRADVKQTNKEEERTAFTEEDFANFEKYYMAS